MKALHSAACLIHNQGLINASSLHCCCNCSYCCHFKQCDGGGGGGDEVTHRIRAELLSHYPLCDHVSSSHM